VKASNMVIPARITYCCKTSAIDVKGFFLKECLNVEHEYWAALSVRKSYAAKCEEAAAAAEIKIRGLLAEGIDEDDALALERLDRIINKVG